MSCLSRPYRAGVSPSRARSIAPRFRYGERNLFHQPRFESILYEDHTAPQSQPAYRNHPRWIHQAAWGNPPLAAPFFSHTDLGPSRANSYKRTSCLDQQLSRVSQSLPVFRPVRGLHSLLCQFLSKTAWRDRLESAARLTFQALRASERGRTRWPAHRQHRGQFANMEHVLSSVKPTSSEVAQPGAHRLTLYRSLVYRLASSVRMIKPKSAQATASSTWSLIQRSVVRPYTAT